MCADFFCVASRDYHTIMMAISSRLPMQIQFALDVLLISSHESALKFNTAPDLLTNLVDFFNEIIIKCLPMQKQVKSEKVKSEHQIEKIKNEIPSAAKEDLFSYSNELESERVNAAKLQGNTRSSLDHQAKRCDYLAAIGLIFRNASFDNDNLQIMTAHNGFRSLLFDCLDLPSKYGPFSYGESLFCTEAYPKTLEHRKNALVCLSNLGRQVPLESVEQANLVMRVCQDFIAEESGTYTYTALEVLSRLYVYQPNQFYFDQCNYHASLTHTLLKLLPWCGFTISPIFSTADLAEYELLMALLTCLITPNHLSEILEKSPELPRIMNNLFKKPIVQGARLPPQSDVLAQFMSIRERSLRILKVIVKSYPSSSIQRRFWEQELYEPAWKSHIENEGWIGNIILEFI